MNMFLKYIKYFCVISLFLPGLSSAETSLWQISKGKNTLSLGGSIHILSEGDYPLPDEFEQAFRESNLLVLETDMTGLMKPEAQVQLAKRLMYSEGDTLKTNIKPKTYRALARYCKSAGLNLAAFNSMKPALVGLTLTLIKLKKSHVSGIGVDQFFLNKANAQGKTVTGLESIDTQMKALENMGEGQENEFILSTIKDLKNTNDFVVNITKAWRTGDLLELERVGIQPMKNEFPKFNQNLLTSRNNAWINKIETMLKTPERELILVGALHLAGPDGLLAQLRKRGISVKPY